MIKVMELSYMIGGTSYRIEDGEPIESPCATIGQQVQEILENNSYKYIDLIYKPKGECVNMEYATLIIEEKNNMPSMPK